VLNSSFTAQKNKNVNSETYEKFRAIIHEMLLILYFEVQLCCEHTRNNGDTQSDFITVQRMSVIAA